MCHFSKGSAGVTLNLKRKVLVCMFVKIEEEEALNSCYVFIHLSQGFSDLTLYGLCVFVCLFISLFFTTASC